VLTVLHVETQLLQLSTALILTQVSKSISKAHLKGGFTPQRFGPTDHRNVISDCLKRLYDKSGCLTSVGRQFYSRSSYTERRERSVAETGPHPTVRLKRSVRVSAERSLPM